MTNVLLIGNGAREHAIAKALVESDVNLHVHMDKKNPGISRIVDSFTVGTILDPRKLPNLDRTEYVVIGPEAPLEKGVADYLEGHDIPCIGPRKSPARIETSKSFARRIIDETYPSANPRYIAARSFDELRKFEDKIGVENIVVKPDGLTGGKGVKIYGDHLSSRKEVEKYAGDILSRAGLVILEEKLAGTEFSVQAFVDGSRLEPMPLVRDYKRAFDGDKGPNTGSMGSYSRADHGLEYVTSSDLETALSIMQSTVAGIKKKTKFDYRGILYGQFMKTSDGIKVIEYNARFGDPEAMNVLSTLKTPIDEIFRSMIDGNVLKPVFENMATVCVYVVPEGYPGPDVVRDVPFSIEPEVTSEIYYASVYEKDDISYTTGSRALGILGKGETLTEAREQAYTDAKRVNGRVRYRSDIAAGE
ncbi:MAG: phosphoribosylamine--glycine ligase [Candidatus Thorarchaeota archaeon]